MQQLHFHAIVSDVFAIFLVENSGICNFKHKNAKQLIFNAS